MKRNEILELFKEDFEKNSKKVSSAFKEYDEISLKAFYYKRLNEILDILEEKKIEFTIEEKLGWGKIFVFYIKGKKVFCNSIKNGKLSVYYYSENYSCKSCRIRF